MDKEELNDICRNKFDFGDDLDKCIKYYNAESGKIADVDPQTGEKIDIPEDKKLIYEALNLIAQTETGQDVLRGLDDNKKIKVSIRDDGKKNSTFNENGATISKPENIFQFSGNLVEGLAGTLAAQKNPQSLNSMEGLKNVITNCLDAPIMQGKFIFEMSSNLYSKIHDETKFSIFLNSFNPNHVLFAQKYGEIFAQTQSSEDACHKIKSLFLNSKEFFKDWFNANKENIPTDLQDADKFWDFMQKSERDKIVQTVIQGNNQVKDDVLTTQQVRPTARNTETQPSVSEKQTDSLDSASLKFNRNFEETLEHRIFRDNHGLSPQQILQMTVGLRQSKQGKDAVKDLLMTKKVQPSVDSGLLYQMRKNVSENIARTSAPETKKTVAQENKTPEKRSSEEIIVDALIKNGKLNEAQEKQVLQWATEIEQKRLAGEKSQENNANNHAEQFIDKISKSNILTDEQKNIALNAAVYAEANELKLAQLKDNIKSKKEPQTSSKEGSSNTQQNTNSATDNLRFAQNVTSR